jgi:SET domain-containing protein
MSEPRLEIRLTEHKGRGLFTVEPIQKGQSILRFQGCVLPSAALTDDLLAMQIDDDLWLCSDGSLLDDCVNHSCEPNAGFAAGDLVLHALRDIEAGEEIAWDYSSSIGEPGWTMECRCGSPRCRRVIRPWSELSQADRDRLREIALIYLRAR